MASLKFRSFSKRAKWVTYPTSVLAMLNFVAFVEGSIYLGGDALNGYVKAGHYFLCAHGNCVEVSGSIWHYSYWHAYSSFLGIVLYLLRSLFLFTSEILRLSCQQRRTRDRSEPFRPNNRSERLRGLRPRVPRST